MSEFTIEVPIYMPRGVVIIRRTPEICYLWDGMSMQQALEMSEVVHKDHTPHLGTALECAMEEDGFILYDTEGSVKGFLPYATQLLESNDILATWVLVIK